MFSRMRKLGDCPLYNPSVGFAATSPYTGEVKKESPPCVKGDGFTQGSQGDCLFYTPSDSPMEAFH